jgi:indole-3-glycerol phosphate synthase
VIDPYQVYEARRAGAEAVLLIVKILEKSKLVELNSLIIELGMVPLVEVQTDEELQLAKAIQPELLLINNRNLDTLQMDLSTVERLVNKLDYPTRVVAASGIENADHMLAMRPFASRFLIGSALMASAEPAENFKEFLSAESRYLKSKEGVPSCQP